MIVALDYDGTITSNIVFYQQLCHMLHRSGHVVIILSGCKPERVEEVKWDLKNINVYYDFLITRPPEVKRGPEEIGSWKKDMLKEYQIDILFDNEEKNYRDAGVIFTDINTQIVRG